MQRLVPLGARDHRWLGDFQILGKLGSGGQGVVYQGRAQDGTRADLPYVVSEYVDGPSLQDVVQSQGTRHWDGRRSDGA